MAKKNKIKPVPRHLWEVGIDDGIHHEVLNFETRTSIIDSALHATYRMFRSDLSCWSNYLIRSIVYKGTIEP